MKFQRLQGGGGGSAQSGPAAADPDVEKWAGALVEWLTVVKWEDGKKRQTGSLMLLAEDGVWKAWMHDRDAGRSCWVSAGTLFDLVIRCEEIVASGAGEWRVDKRK